MQNIPPRHLYHTDNFNLSQTAGLREVVESKNESPSGGRAEPVRQNRKAALGTPNVSELECDDPFTHSDRVCLSRASRR